CTCQGQPAASEVHDSELSPVQQKEAITMVKVGGKTQVEVAELFNVDHSTISRLVSERPSIGEKRTVGNRNAFRLKSCPIRASWNLEIRSSLGAQLTSSNGFRG